MIRLVISMVAFSLLVVQPVMAEEAADSQHADYAILGGASPFGGSLSFATHQSHQDVISVFTLGGLPTRTALHGWNGYWWEQVRH